MSRHRKILSAVLALGFALRLAVAWNLALISGDGITRIGLAGTFRDEGFVAGLKACLVPGYHPFNPLLIRWVGAVTGDLELAGFALSIGLGTLGILGIYLLAREAWGVREGLLAALLWAVLPKGVLFTSDVLTEGQFLCFWIFGAWAGLAALKRGGLRWALLAGVLGGLAYETRVEGVGIPAAVGLTLAVLTVRERSAKRLVQGVLLLAGFLAAAAPYLLHLKAEKGQWILSPQKSMSNLVTAKETVWREPLPDGSPGESGLGDRTALREYARFVQKGVETANVALALALLGLWARGSLGMAGGFLFLLAGLHTLVLLRLLQTAGYANDRHFLTVTAVLVVLAGDGAAWLLARIRGPARAAPAVLLLALAAYSFQDLRHDKTYRKEIGRWLGVHLEPGLPIAHCSKPWIPYYAGRDSQDWASDPAYFLGHMDKAGPLVLVLERKTDRNWVLEAENQPGWTPVPLPAPHDARFVMFRWKGPSSP